MASSVFAPAVHGVSLAGPTTVTRLRRPPAMRPALRSPKPLPYDGLKVLLGITPTTPTMEFATLLAG